MRLASRFAAGVGRLARQPAAKRRLLWQALVVVAVATVALRVVPTVRAPALLRRLARESTRAGRPPIEIVAWAVIAVARYVPGARCLPRALALQALLERAGHGARVCVGLDRCPDGELGGHAWVELVDGRSIAGQEQGEYSPVLVLDSDDAPRAAGPEPAWRRASR
jgi:hypothetical protein